MVALPIERIVRLMPRMILHRLGQGLMTLVPTGLYARALIIIIAPIVLLESVVAFVFMERHWEQVTRRLSESTAGNIGTLIDNYRGYNRTDDYRQLIEQARDRMQLSLQMLPSGELPPPRPKPFFDLLDRTLSAEIGKQLAEPFWIDTVGKSRHVEIRVKLDTAIMRIVATRSQTYASNSHIFLIWMVGSSLVLLTVAILFLRNQIKPILRLAEAADAFGKGRAPPEDFRPRGAREVRQAAAAFLEMRDRIERHMEQRTTMLAGVSHDLRTVLTRFKLQLALMEETPELADLRSDVDEMQLMLEDYLAFAKGGSGEAAAPVDIRDLVEQIRDEAARFAKPIELRFRRRRKVSIELRRHGFKRAIGNLVTNAARYGAKVIVTTRQDRHWLRIDVEDDGPGIPQDKRDIVFRPFYRLEGSRNQDQGNTGLGLAIARDIARVHGGDITLADSELGGLKATIRVPI